VPPAPDFVGQTLQALALRQRYGLTVVTIKRRDDVGREATVVSPHTQE